MRQSPTPFESLRNDREVMDELLSEATSKRKFPREEHARGGRKSLVETIHNLPARNGSPPPARVTPVVTEAIVLATGRPTLLVQNGTFEEPHLSVWKNRLAPHRQRLNGVIPSVGRVELLNHPDYDWLGTAWVVGEGVLVTNRHVAAEFARRNGGGYVFVTNPFGVQVSAHVDFREEYQVDAVSEIEVDRVLYIAEDGPASADVAFLMLRRDVPGLPPPLPLASRDAAKGDLVAVIGYPAFDSRNSGPQMSDIFQDIYDVKRLAPGYVTQAADPSVLEHDCTTLGGNSGSPVVDITTGNVVALHFSGKFGVANFAVKAGAVRQLLGGLRTGVAVRPSGVDEARTRPEHFADRDGYNEQFLGTGAAQHVALPGLSPEQLEDAVRVSNGPGNRGLAGYVLDYRHFSIVMKKSRRVAYFTAVNIDGAHEVKVGSRRPAWVFDPRISREYQIGDEVYGGPNNVDRGHLVRRLDPVWGPPDDAKQAHDDTHIFTNAAPQQHTYNDNDWGDLEDYLLYNTNNDDQKLTIFTGPVFRDGDVQWRGVKIPEEFWKVAVMVGPDGRLHATGYLVSQRPYLDDLEFRPGRFRNYQTPIGRLEELTGLDFGRLKQFDPLAGQESVGPAAMRPLNSLHDIVL